jgi:hypothetical protein
VAGGGASGSGGGVAGAGGRAGGDRSRASGVGVAGWMGRRDGCGRGRLAAPCPGGRAVGRHRGSVADRASVAGGVLFRTVLWPGKGWERLAARGVGTVSRMGSSGPSRSRRRVAVEAVRRCQLRLRLSPAELAAITNAARAEGLAAGAWVGQIAVRFARGETEPLPVTWRDLLGEWCGSVPKSPGCGRWSIRRRRWRTPTIPGAALQGMRERICCAGLTRSSRSRWPPAGRRRRAVVGRAMAAER